MSLSFRLGGPADAGNVRGIVMAAYAKWVPVIGREPMPMRADYDLALRKHRFDLAIEDGAIVGLIETILHDDHLFIENVAVRPEAQGRGVARAAVELAVADAAALLPAGRMLYAFPAVENAASNALCARAGFARLGTERVPFRGTVLHVAVWGRRLDAR